MLKVVGASWYKTKLSSVIILGALLLAFGALFVFNIERPRLENVYCATAYWTPTTGYRVEFWGQGHNLQDIPKGVARICYKGAANDGEWPHMEIETNPSYKDHVQAFSSGILEGSLLWKSIYLQWSETIVAPCALEENLRFCSWLREVVLANYRTQKSQVQDRLRGRIDSYWYQVHLFFQQLEGLDFGWRYGLKRSPMKRSGVEIPIVDYLILNLGADLQLLENHYNAVIAVDEDLPKVKFAARVRKTLRMNLEKDAEQRISLSLNLPLHNSIKSPHRVLKKYKLNYRLSPAEQFSRINAIVPGHEIILTSASGVISSPDDFYAITGRHSRLTVAGIPIQYGSSAASKLDPKNFLFLPARAMAANRLATCSRNWAKLMKRDPQGGAQQWLVLDRKVLHTYNSYIAERKQNELVDASIDARQLNTVELVTERPSSIVEGVAGLLWIVDNVPGRLHAEDVTSEVMEGKRLLHLEGVPHFPETLQESGLLPADDADYEFPKQEQAREEEEPLHSVRFYVLPAMGGSEYAEGLTVIHSEQSVGEDQQHTGHDIITGDRGLVEAEDREPTLSSSGGGFSSKWVWQ